MDRAHVDDRAAALLLVHLAQACARGKEGAVKMNRYHPAPVVEGELVERIDVLDAGIAHQHVDAAIGLDQGGDGAVDLGFLRHIHAQPRRLPAGLADLARDHVRGVEVEIGDAELCALARESERDLAPDPAGGTGDDGNLVLHAHGESPYGLASLGLLAFLRAGSRRPTALSRWGEPSGKPMAATERDTSLVLLRPVLHPPARSAGQIARKGGVSATCGGSFPSFRR